MRNLYPELTRPLPSDLWGSPTWKAVEGEGMAMMGKRPTQAFLRQRAEALFDVEADPVEAENLIDEPALQPVAEEMRSKVKEFRLRTPRPVGAGLAARWGRRGWRADPAGTPGRQGW